VLRDSLTVEIPLFDGSGSTIEKIRVAYEWKPPRCDKCMILGHTLIECPKVILPPAQPTKPVNDGFKTVNNKKKGKQGGPTIPGQGGFTKPVVGKHFQYQPKKTPPKPKKVEVSKMNASDVASSSGTKISTSNQFDALNMEDTDAFSIPSNDTNKDVDSGRAMEFNEVKYTKTGIASQEPLVSDLKEKESVVAPKTSDSCTPPASSTKRVNPFSKVGEIVVSDSEDEVVANPFNESANLFGGGQEFEDWCVEE
jgi:hypothetical protein